MYACLQLAESKTETTKLYIQETNSYEQKTKNKIVKPNQMHSSLEVARTDANSALF